jgi:hypothetical protein
LLFEIHIGAEMEVTIVTCLLTKGDMNVDGGQCFFDANLND